VLVAAKRPLAARWKDFGRALPQPVGLIELADIFVVASETALYLFREDGELIEKRSGALCRVSPAGAGLERARIVLRTASGFLRAPMPCRGVPRRSGACSGRAGQLSAAQRQAYDEALTPGVPVQQLLLDLHSGRFAGRYGPVFVDLLALLLAACLLRAWLFLVPRLHRH